MVQGQNYTMDALKLPSQALSIFDGSPKKEIWFIKVFSVKSYDIQTHWAYFVSK